jgi:hypothetical protein
MTDFDWMSDDTVVIETPADSMLTLTIFRSLSNMGSLDAGDSAYMVGWVAAATASDLANKVFIDSLPDSALTSHGRVVMFDEEMVGFDENTDTFDRRYGAPGYYGRTAFNPDVDTMATGDSIGPYWGLGVAHSRDPRKRSGCILCLYLH